MTSHFTPPNWKDLFCLSLAEVPVMARAARCAGVTCTTVHVHLKTDKEFAERVAAAKEEGIDRAEAEAYRRAVEGFTEPVLYQGKRMYEQVPRVDPDTGEVTYTYALGADGLPVPLVTRRYSDAMLALFLQGRRKGAFSTRTEVTGADGGPVESLDRTQRAQRVHDLLALAASKAAGQAAAYPAPEADDLG